MSTLPIFADVLPPTRMDAPINALARPSLLIASRNSPAVVGVVELLFSSTKIASLRTVMFGGTPAPKSLRMNSNEIPLPDSPMLFATKSNNTVPLVLKSVAASVAKETLFPERVELVGGRLLGRRRPPGKKFAGRRGQPEGRRLQSVDRAGDPRQPSGFVGSGRPRLGTEKVVKLNVELSRHWFFTG